jgi:hypothetical protein
MELLVNIQEPNLKLEINFNSFNQNVKHFSEYHSTDDVCDLKNLSAASRDDEPSSEVEHEMIRTLSERVRFQVLRCARFLTD